MEDDAGNVVDQSAQWYVLWTKSNCEELVYQQLAEKGYELLLPTVDKWSRRKRARSLYRAALFPGYLFVHETINKEAYIEISNTRGMVRILGESWEKLAPVPDQDIEMIRRLQSTDLARMPYPYLKQGQKVRIIGGPLANVEGIFVKSEPEKGLFVLSIELLCRSLAVQVDCTMVTAV